jgi:uncharacterized protein (TIGR03067 family)
MNAKCLQERYMRTNTLSVLLVLFITPHAPALRAPSTANAARLIKQLGSDSYEEREAATRALEAMGERALAALRVANQNSGDAEVKLRANRLIKAIERPTLVREEKELHGTWRVVGVERLGRPVPYDERSQYTFGKDGKLGRRNSTATFQDGTYRLSCVGVLEVVFSNQSHGYRMILYRLKGDTLRLCFDNDGGKRPPRFETREGTKLTVLTLQRQQP